MTSNLATKQDLLQLQEWMKTRFDELESNLVRGFVLKLGGGSWWCWLD